MQTVELLAMIGCKARLTTTEGFEAVVDVLDAKPAYGSMRARVYQPGVDMDGPTGAASSGRWVNASRLRPIGEVKS